MFTEKQIDRFWSNVDIQGEDDCWVWKKKSHSLNGYGLVNLKEGDKPGKLWRVHRLVWTLVKGKIPEGLNVCHKCDNRPCCNPEHLFTGTAKDNVHDSMAKGRFIKGETCGQSKLTEKQVRLVKFSMRHIKPKAIVELLGLDCKPGNIWEIRAELIWKHVRPHLRVVPPLNHVLVLET